MSKFSATLSLSESREALNIVRQWSIDILGGYQLPPDPMLLTFIYEAGDICFFFDHNRSRHLLGSPLLYSFEKREPYSRIVSATAQRIYVVPELYQCLQASDDDFLVTGVLFVK